MIRAFALDNGRLAPIDPEDRDALSAAAWIDVLKPTEHERTAVEHATGLWVSTAEELSEIQKSSRLSYEEEQKALYMSMSFLSLIDEDHPRSTPLGFVLTEKHLITVRFLPSRLFDAMHDRCQRFVENHQTPGHILATILEMIVDRLADELETRRDGIDKLSHDVFHGDINTRSGSRHADRELQAMLRAIGTTGDLISRVRDSLLGLGRIGPFVDQMARPWLAGDLAPRLETVRQDVLSLADYDSHLTEKVQFLLDATLGFINISQNNIMKVFTIVTIVGIPPVLVAGIYGMNFKVMPELEWAWGYPFALVLMVVTAVAPLFAFRWKGWL
jgi:magnesium transporter